MKRNQINFIFSLVLVMALTSCTASYFRKTVGIQKEAPDEFLVLPRTKLKVPETAIALPQPTDKVEGNIAASTQGRKAIFDADVNVQKSAAEEALLNKAKAGEVDPSIRSQVDTEHKEKTGVFGTERGGTLEAIVDPFGYNSAKEPIVDAKKENARIKAALQKGEKVTGKGAITKDPRRERWSDTDDSEEDSKPEEKTEERQGGLSDEELKSGVR